MPSVSYMAFCLHKVLVCVFVGYFVCISLCGYSTSCHGRTDARSHTRTHRLAQPDRYMRLLPLRAYSRIKKNLIQNCRCRPTVLQTVLFHYIKNRQVAARFPSWCCLNFKLICVCTVSIGLTCNERRTFKQNLRIIMTVVRRQPCSY